jgi:hypothetical protein
MKAAIKEQRCLRCVVTSIEDLTLRLNLKAPIMDIEFSHSTGRVKFFLWDENSALTEAEGPEEVWLGHLESSDK